MVTTDNITDVTIELLRRAETLLPDDIIGVLEHDQWIIMTINQLLNIYTILSRQQMKEYTFGDGDMPKKISARDYYYKYEYQKQYDMNERYSKRNIEELIKLMKGDIKKNTSDTSPNQENPVSPEDLKPPKE